MAHSHSMAGATVTFNMILRVAHKDFDIRWTSILARIDILITPHRLGTCLSQDSICLSQDNTCPNQDKSTSQNMILHICAHLSATYI